MEKLFTGYGFAKGDKLILCNTSALRKTTKLCELFIDTILQLNGKQKDVSYYNEDNFKYIRYGLTKVDVYYNEELKYYHIEFCNGVQNIPEDEKDCLIIIQL